MNISNVRAMPIALTENQLKNADVYFDIHRILKGITEEECHSDIAWWSTSEGAEYGKEQLKELFTYVETLLNKDSR